MPVDLTKKLDKIFHDRVRLGIMSALLASEHEVSFTDLVNTLDVTRGNLSVHIKVLENNQFIKSKKTFVNNKPRTTLSVTDKGRKAFEHYLSLLEEIIKSVK
ncbi:ArsR family transcriptional regulator [candidate division KSB1 bacterium]|nr:transcriptional regulator [candidate division KSB1 bacterium]RQW02591.1 MAG: ArsR family transcriptional regulator [candidate division KSB1 bacterium]